MPRNRFGGKNGKKMKNSGPVKKNTLYPDENQYFGIVTKFCSHSCINLVYAKKKQEDLNYQIIEGIGKIRGKMIKRMKKLPNGTLLIVSEREFETQKAIPTIDIIHKYRDDELSYINKLIPSELKNIISSTNEKEEKVENTISFEDNDNYDFDEEINLYNSKIKKDPYDITDDEDEDIVYVGANDPRLT